MKFMGTISTIEISVTRSKNQGDSSEVVAETCLTSLFFDRRAKKTSPKNFGLKEIQCKFRV